VKPSGGNPYSLNFSRLVVIDYIRYQEVTSESKATQESVDKLAEKINNDWWERNKDTFLK
jgi:hypothetical protein